MRIDLQTEPFKPFDVIDLATGQPVKDHDDVYMADEEKGEYGVIVKDASGNAMLNEDKTDVVREVRSCQVRIVMG
jgi:hypothetical protein